jgi:hypothetical protein
MSGKPTRGCNTDRISFASQPIATLMVDNMMLFLRNVRWGTVSVVAVM